MDSEPTGETPRPGENALLQRLFANVAGLDYCVLRNAESLPDRVPGTDIDVIISRDDRATFDRGVRAAAAEGWGVATEFERAIGVRRLMLTKPALALDGERAWVLLEVADCLSWRGAAYLHADAVLRHRTPARGIYVLPHPIEAAVITATNLLYRGAVHDQYDGSVAEATTTERDQFEPMLAEMRREDDGPEIGVWWPQSAMSSAEVSSSSRLWNRHSISSRWAGRCLTDVRRSEPMMERFSRLRTPLTVLV